MSFKKVLILSRSLHHIGGVVKYCNSVVHNFKNNSIVVEHFVIGTRPGQNLKIVSIIQIIKDYYRFFFKLMEKKISLIHLNPSLRINSIIRDSIFLLIAKIFKKKVIIFWHGWEKSNEQKINQSIIIKWLFKRLFDNADVFIVLACHFKKMLEEWGFKQKIIVETTIVDDCLIRGFSPEKKIRELKGVGKLKLLYFSRIQITKGIFETVDAFNNLDQDEREVELIIAGDGPDFDLLKRKINNINNDKIKICVI
jgi:glycosyltransferase involved in cell wall biosynthesis